MIVHKIPDTMLSYRAIGFVSCVLTPYAASTRVDTRPQNKFWAYWALALGVVAILLARLVAKVIQVLHEHSSRVVESTTENQDEIPVPRHDEMDDVLFAPLPKIRPSEAMISDDQVSICSTVSHSNTIVEARVISRSCSFQWWWKLLLSRSTKTPDIKPTPATTDISDEEEYVVYEATSVSTTPVAM